MKRIMIIGGPGSGKSTLVRRIGAATGLPVVHVDQIHWCPGWIERPRAEKIAMARAIEEQETWVFEGGLHATHPTRSARADIVAFLDVPMLRRLWRVLNRIRLYKGETRPDLPPDCPERFDWEFIHWIVTTARKNRARDLALIAALPPRKGRILRRNVEIDAFVAEVADAVARKASGVA
jgi:adenylate kinase family enzyme